MALVGEVSGKFNKTIKEPVFRFHTHYQKFGFDPKGPDTRSSEQLLEAIDYYAQCNPEVAKFKNVLKSMNPKHLGLVSDICEFAKYRNAVADYIDTINITTLQAANGKSLFSYLLEVLPKASKENPEALDFAKEVVDNVGSKASKFFLVHFAPVFSFPTMSKRLADARPVIKDIAKITMSDATGLGFSHEQALVNELQNITSSSVMSDKVKILPRVFKTIDEAVIETCAFDMNHFLHDDTPISIIEDNLAIFPQVAENLAKKGVKEVVLNNFLYYNRNLH